MNDYEILGMKPAELSGLSPDDKKAKLKMQYHKLSLKWHPDKNPSEEATEKFKHINNAYHNLLKLIDDPKSNKQPETNNLSKANYQPKANTETKSPEQRATDTRNQKLKEKFTVEYNKLLDARVETLRKNGFLNSEYEKYIKNHKSYDEVYNQQYETQYKDMLSFYKESYDFESKVVRAEIKEAHQEIKNAETQSFWGWALALPTLGLSLMLVVDAEASRQAAEEKIKLYSFAKNAETPEQAAHQAADWIAEFKANRSRPLSRSGWETKVRHDVTKTQGFQKQVDELWKTIHTENATESKTKAAYPSANMPASQSQENVARSFSKA